ncbi:hypothetical protein [Streptosporangium sp. NBC_01756]|uniref:hypothetical protein n=1 Tax=Streptosporangium sp. NBC_01756 TaxID=2975950 RepID=UPI002DD9C716|nr:hypothetical protein [Streptosporangium sp. NBC_01756]WSC88002.1 hypothetical protein OIE48_07255 [Streptosporangium sp. NBC_01756]
MTRLREALNGIADEAPSVNLAELALAGHRRRRRTTLTLTAIAAVVALGVGTASVTLLELRGDYTATQQRVDTVPDLPDGKVGSLSYAYQTPCKLDMERHIDCSATEWRVVTRTGTTYRVPQALVRNAKEQRVPISISRDGRMLAYYSRQAQAHVVRDLVSGSEVTSSVTVKEERIGMGSMLVVSDDGRYVVFDPREGSKEPGLLIDMRTGKTRSVPGKYETVSIKGGVAELVRYRKTDLWLMPVTGGGAPVRFDGVFIMFSELAPDGRTVAAFEFEKQRLERRTLTLLDAKTGRTLRKVVIRGLPKDGGVLNTSPWRSGSEVTLAYQDKGGSRIYAIDVNTGQARQLAHYPSMSAYMLFPGVASSI